MKRYLTALFILTLAGVVAWFFLFRPETVSQETLMQDFATHRQAYEDIAAYLQSRHIHTVITDIPIAGQSYEGVVPENSDAYSAFMDGLYVIMGEDHDRIISDGKTVEFVYHSTGGAFVRVYGSVIYTGRNQVDGKITVPLKAAGWHLYLSKD
jgi:hypothetical protein